MKLFWSIVLGIEGLLLLIFPVKDILTADNDNSKGLASAFLLASIFGFTILDLILFGIMKFLK